MKTRRMRTPLLLLTVAFSACVHSFSLDDAIEQSFSFRRAYALGGSRSLWFIDGTNGGYPVIYVGFDEGTHTTRFATLRIRGHGIVEREQMRQDGELIWVEDR